MDDDEDSSEEETGGGCCCIIPPRPIPRAEESDENLSPAKKLRTSDYESLEERLNGILCCAVCLDLPKTAVYQVGVII